MLKKEALALAALFAVLVQTPALPDNADSIGVFQMPIADTLPLPESEKAQPAWSLPIEGLLNAHAMAAQQPRRLDASINMTDGLDPVAARIDQLLDTALARDPQTEALDKAVAHFRTRTQQAIAQTKDTADYIVPYRGFGPSSEAGDVILDEKVKLKSRAAAEYARQKHIDGLHLQVVATVMQIAMGLGTADKVQSQQITANGMESLKNLVGDQEARQTLDLLNTWCKEIDVPPSVYSQGVWDVAHKQEKLQAIMADALDSDPVLHEVTRRVHKYNHRTAFARASAHAVQTTLGIASLTPDFVGPAAKAALVTFVMATGGPEQTKLLKELYLDKRFDSRWKALNEQAHLALENYQIAILTHNPALLASCESIVQDITGPETVKKVFGQSVLQPQSQALAASGAGTQ